MYFIVDDSIKKDDKDRLINAIYNNGGNVLLVKSIPFTNFVLPVSEDINLLSENSIRDKLIDLSRFKNGICFGKNSLIEYVSTTSMSPGVFLNDNFDYKAWLANWGRENLLNDEVLIGKIGEIVPPENMEEFFIRPCQDNKHIAGGLMERAEFLRLVGCLEEDGEGLLTKQTEVLISRPKKISKEYRAFVVGGQIVAGSLYRDNFELSIKEGLPSEAILFLASLFLKWTPSDSFVIDVAEVNGKYKIIEVNNINSSGFYGADIEKIIKAMIVSYEEDSDRENRYFFEKMCMIDYDLSDFGMEGGTYINEHIQSMWVGFEMGLYLEKLGRDLCRVKYGDLL